MKTINNKRKSIHLDHNDKDTVNYIGNIIDSYSEHSIGSFNKLENRSGLNNEFFKVTIAPSQNNAGEIMLSEQIDCPDIHNFYCYPFCFYDSWSKHKWIMIQEYARQALDILKDKKNFGNSYNLFYVKRHNVTILNLEFFPHIVFKFLEAFSFDEIKKLTLTYNYDESPSAFRATEILARCKLDMFARCLLSGHPEILCDECIEPHYLFGVFDELIELGLNEEILARFFHSAWENQLGFSHQLDRIQEFLNHFPQETYESLMSPDDYEVYQNLHKNKSIKVYRGIMGENENEWEGFSWTLDKERAEFFAYTYHHFGLPKSDSGFVIEATIDPKAIYFYSSSRSESEVVISPADIQDVKVISKRRRAA